MNVSDVLIQAAPVSHRPKLCRTERTEYEEKRIVHRRNRDHQHSCREETCLFR